MALRPNRPTGPGPVREPGRQSLLNLADLNAGATRRRRLRWKMLTGLSATGLALAGGLALVALQIPQLGPAIRAGHGDGTRGEFTLQQYDCGRFSCTWAGVFVADKGRLTLPPGEPAQPADPADRFRDILIRVLTALLGPADQQQPKK
jgi:hypothetical protein